MGYAANGHCHPTAAAAASYDCGHNYPQAWGVGQSVGVVSCTGTADSVLTLAKAFDGGQAVAFSVSGAYPECSESDWLTYTPFSLSATDGALVAAAVASVWLAAWAWRSVYMTLRGSDEE